MLEGKCPKCGYECAGWGLSFPRHQACAHCGTGLIISEDGHTLGSGYSPFTAKKEYDGRVKDTSDTASGKREDK